MEQPFVARKGAYVVEMGRVLLGGGVNFPGVKFIHNFIIFNNGNFRTLLWRACQRL